jgi:hypothetical protein
MTPDEMREKGKRECNLSSNWQAGLAWLIAAEVCERLEWLKPLIFVPEGSVELQDLMGAKPGSIIRVPAGGQTGLRYCQDVTGCIWDCDTREWIVRAPGCPLEHCEGGLKL